MIIIIQYTSESDCRQGGGARTQAADANSHELNIMFEYRKNIHTQVAVCFSVQRATLTKIVI